MPLLYVACNEVDFKKKNAEWQAHPKFGSQYKWIVEKMRYDQLYKVVDTFFFTGQYIGPFCQAMGAFGLLLLFRP